MSLKLNLNNEQPLALIFWLTGPRANFKPLKSQLDHTRWLHLQHADQSSREPTRSPRPNTRLNQADPGQVRQAARLWESLNAAKRDPKYLHRHAWEISRLPSRFRDIHLINHRKRRFRDKENGHLLNNWLHKSRHRHHSRAWWKWKQKHPRLIASHPQWLDLFQYPVTT